MEDAHSIKTKKFLPQGIVLGCALIALGFLAWGYAKDKLKQPGQPLDTAQTAAVNVAIDLMRKGRLTAQANLAEQLITRGIWRAANPDDVYLKNAEKAGDTPYAYTLSEGKQPSAIVLAPRFFEATPAGQASLMLHELGHYAAYVQRGKSDEYDGYKAQFDTHKQIGLTEQDGLAYFALLDGVAQYVVPRDRQYKKDPEIAAYLKG